MRVLLQWTRAAPRGWEEIDSTQWQALPKRPEPRGSEALDDQPGWIYRLNVQSLDFTADHYAVEPLPGRACRVTIWNDDPEDYPDGEKYARIWTFKPLRPDPAFGGQWNTSQTQVIYAEQVIAARMMWAGVPENAILPFSQFTPPDERNVRHGIWVPQDLNARHDAERPERDWREWVEGIPERLLDEKGRLRLGAR